MRRLCLASFVLIAFGCGDDEEPLLVETTDIETGNDDCPLGGVRIRVGADADGDGALSDEEASDTVICNGVQPADLPEIPAIPEIPELVTRTTMVDPGDECQYGGVRIESGLDNGSGEGEAGNGMLDDSEVTSTTLVCNSGPAPELPESRIPTGAAGSASIDFSGGDSTDDGGASGGDFDFFVDEDGLQRSHMSLFGAGSVDASCTAVTITAELGADPLTVSTDTTIDTAAPEDADGFYIDESGQLLFYDDDEGEAREVTGLQVDADATLTLDASVFDSSFSADVNVLGSIVTANNVQRLQIEGRHIVVGSDGEITAPPGAAVVTLTAGGHLQVAGTITSQSASGAGGEINLNSGGSTSVSGTLDASGADSDAEAGTGGAIYVSASVGGVCLSSSASFLANGGSGSGADGGDIYVESAPLEFLTSGSGLRSEASFDASGGNGTCADCAAGGGGRVALICVGGDMVVDGDITVAGGNASTAEAGSGGGIGFWSYSPDSRSANVSVGADLDASGGNGESSGSGGEIQCGGGGLTSIGFYGYGSVDGSGGNGTAGGGSGGTIDFTYYPVGSRSTQLPAIVETDVVADLSGGDATDGSGGGGGEVLIGNTPRDFIVRVTLGGPDPEEVPFALPPEGYPPSTVAGNFDISGGNGGGDGGGGDAGTFGATIGAGTPTRVANNFVLDLDLDADGGASAASTGGRGGDLALVGRSDISASGTYDQNGGASADGSGGDAGIFALTCEIGSTAGTVNLTGGDGAGSEAGGGNGGLFVLLSTSGPSSQEATVDVSAGSPDGEAGESAIDDTSVFSRFERYVRSL